MNKNNILKMQIVDLKKIVFDSPSTTNNGNFIVSSMWYKREKELHTLNVQTPYMKVFKFLDSNQCVILLPDKETEDFFEKVDKCTQRFIIDNNLIKKYSLRNFSYKTLINEVDGLDNCVLRTRICNEKKPTLFFSSKNKTPMEYNEAKNIFFKVDNLKIIFEMDKMIIDLKNKIIYTNIVARLIMLHEIVPKKIEISEYSFIDSDNDSNNSENENDNKTNNKKYIDENDMVLNTQTEYIDDYDDKEESDKEEEKNRNGNKIELKNESKYEIDVGETDFGKESPKEKENGKDDKEINNSDSDEEYDYDYKLNEENELDINKESKSLDNSEDYE